MYKFNDVIARFPTSPLAVASWREDFFSYDPSSFIQVQQQEVTAAALSCMKGAV